MVHLHHKIATRAASRISWYIRTVARTPGSRNTNFEARKRDLALAAADALIGPEGGPASFRSLVAATGASASVLQHYFGAHEGLVRAAFQAVHDEGAPYNRAMADPGDRPLAASLTDAAAFLRRGWAYGVGTLQAAGLVHGLKSPTLGPAYVEMLLEPTIQSVEARLGVHRARGELRAEADLRFAALAFVSPLFLALLHQGELTGVACRPLDVDAFVAAHVEGFVAGWGARPAAAASVSGGADLPS